jgi:uracil-DNA glycosylase family 4
LIHTTVNGPTNAKLLIVGEAPGYEEEISGVPFCGSSGRLLNDMLSSCGIERSAVYTTNVIKIRPPNNNFDAFYDDGRKRKQPSAFLQESIENLKDEIRAVKPNAILALGNEALRALTGYHSVEKWRGSIIPTPLGKVIPSYHPTYILRIYQDRVIAELDIRRAIAQSSFPQHIPRAYDFLLSPTKQQVLEALDYFRSIRKPVAFDIETTGRTVRCLGLANSPTRAICIPFLTLTHQNTLPTGVIFDPKVNASGGEYHYWTESDEAEILKALSEFFRDEKTPKLAHNYPFDATRLMREMGLHCRGLFMDTMVAQHTLYPELPKGLDFLASIYTPVPYYSDYSASSDVSTWTYNCYDVVVTYESHEVLYRELQEAGLWDFYENHQIPVLHAITRAQNKGNEIDQSLREKLIITTKQTIESTEQEILRSTGLKVNTKSPKQMQELLYQHLKMKPVIDRKTKNITTNAEALRSLKKKYPQHHEILGQISRCNKARDFISKFLMAELNIDGRLETSYNLTGTVNGRLSSSATLFDGGANLQNIPRGEARRTFIAGRQNVMVKVDLSQAEARVVAWTAPIPFLVERFQDPKFDIHRWNASNIFKVPESEVTKDQRNVGKPGVHGGNYGMGEGAAAALYDCPKEVAKASIEAYRNALPELISWWAEIQQTIQQTRTLTTPFGRRRMFFGRLDEDLYRSAYSFIPQAVVADDINRAFALGEYVLHDLQFAPKLQIHDEIVWVGPLAKLHLALPRIKTLMEPPIIFPRVDVPLVIPTDVSFGPNWYDQTKWTDNCTDPAELIRRFDNIQYKG